MGIVGEAQGKMAESALVGGTIVIHCLNIKGFIFALIYFAFFRNGKIKFW